MVYNNINEEKILAFIELNPRCTRKALMHATGLIKCTLGKNIARIKPMLTVEVEYINGKLVEHYTINQSYDDQTIVIKSFEPIKFKHHPLFALYGISA